MAQQKELFENCLPDEKEYLGNRALAHWPDHFIQNKDGSYSVDPKFLESRKLNKTDSADLTYLTEGLKYDDDKLAWHLLPIEGAEELIKVMQFGAKKYGDYNWYLGIDHLRLFNAALRHLWAWFKREDIDPESGCSHLAHACCCVLMLTSMVKLKRGKDGRKE